MKLTFETFNQAFSAYDGPSPEDEIV